MYKSQVYALVARYEALSEEEKNKITGWKDVLQTKLQMDTLTRTLAIASVLTVGIGSVLAILILRRKRRKNKEKCEIEELDARVKVLLRKNEKGKEEEEETGERPDFVLEKNSRILKNSVDVYKRQCIHCIYHRGLS